MKNSWRCFPNRISVDIPREEKLRRNLYILARNEARLCPYVDREREEYWKSKMDDAIRSQPSPRILFLCGSNHLYSFREKPVSFPDILRNAGYSVECCDLRKEHCWNESWTKGWIDPDPPANVITAASALRCCLDIGFDSCNRADDP